MPRVIHFELAADDPEKTAEFYRNVFGWKSEKWNGPRDYWLCTTGPESEPGINGAILRKEDTVSNAGFCPTISVPSVEACIEAVAEHGGKVVMPRTPVPGIGYLAYCADPGGIVFGIMERDDSA
ncbi:MAG: hypothetical protein APR53_09925 [Methanoculleus sp. SDB]|nr:MAG: hypothetical protein APR53_09925 [Methanoculleus sp. SDB]